jgi:flagella basal body P-ring formation protein FlgA
VRKGDPVRVVIDTPALRLSVPGEALQDGGEGDPVRVKNASSGKELTAQVVAHGVVLVAPR